MNIFRAVPREGFKQDRTYEWRESTRLPGNVSYLVDNLWEYVRPGELPSRRHAVYASPSAALALAGAATPAAPADRFIACRVVLAKPPTLFQASVSDARFHPDVSTLQKLVNRYLQDPAHASLNINCLAPLFLPGTNHHALQHAMQESAELAAITGYLAKNVKMWQDEPDTQTGEIIFTIEPGNSYQLVPV